jgi:hypothetical protein
MTHIFWIIGLTISLLVFSGVVIICLVALNTDGHLNFTGWMMLVFNAIAVMFIFARLRSAIEYGGPTEALKSPHNVVDSGVA